MQIFFSSLAGSQGSWELFSVMILFYINLQFHILGKIKILVKGKKKHAQWIKNGEDSPNHPILSSHNWIQEDVFAQQSQILHTILYTLSSNSMKKYVISIFYFKKLCCT